MFSIKAIAAAASLGTLRTSTGTSFKPASLAARLRLSPAMISYLPAFLPLSNLRTKIGCMMPWALMLSASSYKAPSSMRVRGWYMPGTSSVKGKVLGSPCFLLAAATAASSTLGPSNASSPRPRPLGFLVTIFFFSRCSYKV